MKYLVCYVMEGDGPDLGPFDHWIQTSSMEEAERVYADLLDRADVYSVSICQVLRSSDDDDIGGDPDLFADAEALASAGMGTDEDYGSAADVL